MKKLLFTLALALLCGCTAQSDITTKRTIERADRQMTQMIDGLDKLNRTHGIRYPRTIENGKVLYVDNPDWTIGYFPGTLWYLSQLSEENGAKWRDEAKKYTEFMSPTQYTEGLHDIGVMMMASYGSGVQFGEREAYAPEVIQSARTLMRRFAPKSGTIQSWGPMRDPSLVTADSPWRCSVIIDGMIVLENLFQATALSQDSTFHYAAVAHANATMKNHFREDYSSYHLVDYSLHTGEVTNKRTVQGWKDDSSWARGQAWGLYGFTVCYRYTNDKRYLEQAKNIASYIIGEFKKVDDGVFFWDYDCDKVDSTPRDASAAALVASGLYELSDYTNSKEYIEVADKIIASLSSDKYLAEEGENGNFILMHSVGHFSRNIEVDVPLNYADYYFLEALYRRKLINEGKSVGYIPEVQAKSNDRWTWLSAMDKISRPVFQHLADGELKRELPSSNATRGPVYQLEAVGRAMYGISTWLESESGDAKECALRDEYRKLIIKGLTNMADESNPDYIRFDVNSQNLVDAAFFAHALLLTRESIWNNLDAKTQQSLVESLAKTNKFKPVMSNWLLFTAMVQVALNEFGGEWDASKVHFAIDKMKDWYKGDGTYGDGHEYQADYYNSYVIHPMLLFCIEYLNQNGIETSISVKDARDRMTRYAEIQERQIAADGSYPIIGRSICYRFGAFHALADAAYRQILPYWVKPAQVRSAMTTVIEKTMAHDKMFDRDGWLRKGVYGYQPSTAEHYITTGSLYLVNFAFLPLGLPTEDPFWSDPYTQWTSVKADNERYIELDMAVWARTSPNYKGKVKQYNVPLYK